jgi:hypothetical protein
MKATDATATTVAAREPARTEEADEGLLPGMITVLAPKLVLHELTKLKVEKRSWILEAPAPQV